jgi:hypothetical protein
MAETPKTKQYHLELPADVVAQVHIRAAARQISPARYIREAVKRAVDAPEFNAQARTALARASFTASRIVPCAED